MAKRPSPHGRDSRAYIDVQQRNAIALPLSCRKSGLPLVGSTELAEVGLVALLFLTVNRPQLMGWQCNGRPIGPSSQVVRTIIDAVVANDRRSTRLSRENGLPLVGSTDFGELPSGPSLRVEDSRVELAEVALRSLARQGSTMEIEKRSWDRAGSHRLSVICLGAVRCWLPLHLGPASVPPT